jgi:hypothetical protein
VNDPIQFAKQMADLVRDQVTRATAPLVERLATLEDRPEPKDGTSVTIDDVMPALLAAIPSPVPGTSVTIDDVMPTLLAAIPEPVPGKSVELDEVLAVLSPRVDEAISAIPAPKDGKSVTIEQVKGLLESYISTWALDFERRAQDILQRAIERIPAPRDGKDATELADFDLLVDEEARTVTLTMGTAEGAKSVTRKASWLLDRGIYSAGKSYDRGDTVSWGGNLWIAQVDGTKTMPAEAEPEWRLAVRKGRDGRNGIDRSAEGKPVKLA